MSPSRVLQVLFLTSVTCNARITDAERRNAFIGYSEKTRLVENLPQKLDIEKLNSSEPILLSKTPCAYLLPQYISEQEATDLIEQANPRLRSQQFRDQPDTRTSWGATFYGQPESLTYQIIKRSENMVQTARSDGIEVKRYRVNEKYNSHHDYFSSPTNKLKNERVATFLIYLKTAEVGGETMFPWAGGKETIDPRTGWPYRPLDYNKECEPGTMPESALKVKVPTGSAVVFYSLHQNGTVDPYSQHGSCPVTEGEKWTATVWTRATDAMNPSENWKTADLLARCES
ncbi:hypothetical protein CYMTET_19106 [Cymbomonas tetramitiformis]|uniref:Fe2OG dioxygenase domain-containing protein n=1 Tax=Cymbomonas tetramitiformis TaxID=36881 RepID=A0AAE0G6R5_9CHLO|nr:hypothetical protein CYMTET_19106 [Cymbomonas tetramitiformis]|eukprot:gene9220-10927_t